MSRVGREVLGGENVTMLPKPMMGSEDVGYYFQKVPGVIGWLGGMPEAGPVPQHNPHFKIDLNALPYGDVYKRQERSRAGSSFSLLHTSPKRMSSLSCANWGANSPRASLPAVCLIAIICALS